MTCALGFPRHPPLRNTMETVLGNARLTACSTDSPERTEEARRQVHMMLYESRWVGSREKEREQILAILRPCCPGDVLRFEPARDDPVRGICIPTMQTISIWDRRTPVLSL